jgi:hypothetical protein
METNNKNHNGKKNKMQGKPRQEKQGREIYTTKSRKAETKREKTNMDE